MKRRMKEIRQYFNSFQLQPHTPNLNTQSTFNPRMYDDGTVVSSTFPHLKVWSSNSRNILLCPL